MNDLDGSNNLAISSKEFSSRLNSIESRCWMNDFVISGCKNETLAQTGRTKMGLKAEKTSVHGRSRPRLFGTNSI